jgi:hypothetical protein
MAAKRAYGHIQPVGRRALLALDDRAVRNEPGVEEPPQCDNQLARQRYDRDPPDSALRIADSRVEPPRQAARQLITKPQPRQLDGVMPGPSVATLADPLLAAGRAAAVGRRAEADETGDRASIGKGAIEDLGG